MSESTPPEPAISRVAACPHCGADLPGEGDADCFDCGATVLRFRPVDDTVAMAPGTGRCAAHPGKDAVDGCGRCGAFVCDLCRTRTGTLVLCPPCFDALHARSELETTRRTRFRVDHFATGSLILAFIPFLGCLAVPVALGTGIWGLTRAGSEPWISRGHCVAAIVLSLLLGLGSFALIGGGMWG